MLIDGLLTQPPPLQSICKTLMILDLQNNYITHIDELYFVGCIKLSTLSFHRNMLLSMPNIRYMAHTLTTLDLSRNQLSGTYLYFVKLFHRLHTIHLHFNYLTAFCMQQIKFLPFIGFISLNNNNITYVKFDYLPDRQGRLLNKIFLTMHNNPLQCDRDWNNTCDNRQTFLMCFAAIIYNWKGFGARTTQVNCLNLIIIYVVYLISFKRDEGDISRR